MNFTSAAGSTECCNIAGDNLFSVFSAENDQSSVCNSSEPYPFTHPNELRRVGIVESLLAGVYVVPSFEFDCSGCIEAVQMQGLLSDSSTPVTISLLTWSVLESEDEVDLYRLGHNVSVMSNDIQMRHDAAKSQLTLIFTLPEGNQLCFEANERLGFSFEASNNLSVILENEGDDSVYQLEPSISETCPSLENLYTFSNASSNRIPLMAVRISKSKVYIHILYSLHIQRIVCAGYYYLHVCLQDLFHFPLPGHHHCP